MKTQREIPKYWIWNGKAVKSVDVGGKFSTETKSGEKVPFVSVFQDGTAVDKNTYDSTP